MRAIVAVIVLLIVGSATSSHARVVMMPTIQSNCPSGRTWGTVASCLAKFGKTKVLRSRHDLRVAQITDATSGFRVPGIYIYVQQGTSWVLGGSLEGTDYAFVSIDKIRAGRFHGYRMDVRVSRADDVVIAERSRHVHVRENLAVFCSGHTPGCSVARTSCDVYLDGKSYWTFRGKVEPLDDQVRIRGDRSSAGEECNQEEIVDLPFTGVELD